MEWVFVMFGAVFILVLAIGLWHVLSLGTCLGRLWCLLRGYHTPVMKGFVHQTTDPGEVVLDLRLTLSTGTKRWCTCCGKALTEDDRLLFVSDTLEYVSGPE